jgi:hypothetical protein
MGGSQEECCFTDWALPLPIHMLFLAIMGISVANTRRAVLGH